MRFVHSVPWCCMGVALTIAACGASNKESEHDAGPDAAAKEAGPGNMKDASTGGKDASGGSKDAGAHDAAADASHLFDAETFDVKLDGGPPGNDKCTKPQVITLDNPNQEIDIVAITVGATHDVDAPCQADPGADVFYQFALSKRAFVYADTFGASWNTLLYFLTKDCAPITTTTTGDAVCNDDGCGMAQSQVVALLESGTYILGLSGTGGATGIGIIHLQWAVAGNGPVVQLPQGDSSQDGTTAGSSGNIEGLTMNCFAAAPENSYWWDNCPADPGGTLTASTCKAVDGGANFETVLEAEIPPTVPYGCNVDSCGLQTNLSEPVPAGAGLRVLTVDGQDGTDKGPYTVVVSRP